MAKGSSKSTVLKNAQKVAAATTMDSVARNAGKYDAKNRAKQADSQTADKSASGPKHSKKAEKKMSPARKALVVFAVAMLVVLGCCCVAFAASEESRSQYVPEATMLDGQVDISGMTADELRALLVKRVEGGIATTITLEAGDSSHAIEMGEIGTIDIDATVEQAFAPYRANPVVRVVVTVGELIGMPPAGHDVCTVCVVDHDALVDRVAAVAQKANAPAKNAGYAYDKTSNALVVAAAIAAIIFLLTFVHFTTPNSYLLVVHYDEEAEYDVDQMMRRSVKNRRLRSKTMTRSGAEMTWEVRLDNKQDLVALMLGTEGVHDATLVACQTEAGT